jgi:hypothetical protein
VLIWRQHDSRPTENFTVYKSFYPSTCRLTLNGTTYFCDYVVVGAFNDGSGNLKLCSQQYCLILELTASQLANVASQRDFYVYQMSWQQASSIVSDWNSSMRCGISSTDGIGCIGTSDNGAVQYIHNNASLIYH